MIVAVACAGMFAGLAAGTLIALWVSDRAYRDLRDRLQRS
jgi:hypothetical protein